MIIANIKKSDIPQPKHASINRRVVKGTWLNIFEKLNSTDAIQVICDDRQEAIDRKNAVRQIIYQHKYRDKVIKTSTIDNSLYIWRE